MRRRIEVDGQSGTLTLQQEGDQLHYSLIGFLSMEGETTISQIVPGVFSVLIEGRSFTVYVAPNGLHGKALEVVTGSRRHIVSVADFRDVAATERRTQRAGPTEVRAQMPGKIIKLLVEAGSVVEQGQGLIVVEAMKMQNEMKSPKAGTVTKIPAREGTTVVAGEVLLVVE